MRRLLLVLAAVLLMPTAAQAAGPKVTWPEQRTYAPGEKLKVKVVSKQRVRVVLVRESANGRVLRTVARRTLRSGTFSAAAPSAGRYSLRVGARARTVTVATPTSSGPLAPVADPQLPDCARPTGDRAELRLGAASAPAGGTLPLEVVNTSTGCLMLGVGYSFERLLGDGTWVTVPSNQMFILIGVLLGPGDAYAKQAVIPADAVPGTYRVLDTVSGAVSIPLAAQFQVTG